MKRKATGKDLKMDALGRGEENGYMDSWNGLFEEGQDTRSNYRLMKGRQQILKKERCKEERKMGKEG